MRIDCTHPRANHQHGTPLAYQRDDCRCDPCREAYRVYNKRVSYRTLTGTHSYVDADLARTHVRRLLTVLTVGQVEQRSGVHRTAIRLLVGDWPGKPPSRRISGKTHAALMAVRPTRVGSEESGLVDATGTRRRLQALIALGWPANQLGRMIGASSCTVPRITNGDDVLVLVATRAAVMALYDDLSLTVPPEGRIRTLSRGIARRKGWVPPLAWDDDTIDDPSASPEGYERKESKKHYRDDVLEDFEDTRGEHLGDVRLAAMRLGMSHSSLSQTLHRAVAEGMEVAFFNVYRSDRKEA